MIVDHRETPSERFDRELRETFPAETSRLDRAAESFATASAALLRPDGSRRYSDAEHEERTAALLGQLDTVGAAVTSAASAAIAQAEAEIVKLDGADPWDTLSESERQRASTRQPFISEDARDGRPEQIAKQARAAIAAGDKPGVYLWARGVRRRVDAAHDQQRRAHPELSAVLHELEATFGDPTRKRQQQHAIERRIESAKLLTGRVRQARSAADGSQARAAADSAAYWRARF